MIDASLTITPRNVRNMHAVYEHHIASAAPGQPPELIYVGACKLIDAYLCIDAMNNSHWAEITNAGSIPIIVRIIHVDADAAMARAIAIRHVKSLAVMPRCNLHGYNLHTVNRPLIASNGETYQTQRDAAAALNVTQAAISHHMRGKTAHVRGVTFTYATATDGAI